MSESESEQEKKSEVSRRNPERSSQSLSEAGRKGGEAEHSVRGLQAADQETRERVASAGGSAPHRMRGLQAADEETRERVARAGGEARGRGRRGENK
jgi:hypothetical protein